MNRYHHICFSFSMDSLLQLFSKECPARKMAVSLLPLTEGRVGKESIPCPHINHFWPSLWMLRQEEASVANRHCSASCKLLAGSKTLLYVPW